MVPQTHESPSCVKGSLDGLVSKALSLFKRLLMWLQPAAESPDYQAWQHQFLRDRLWLAVWIAIPCVSTLLASSTYVHFFNFSQFNEDITKLFGDPNLADRARTLTVVAYLVMGVLLLTCLLLQRTKWGQRHPTVLFLWLSWSLTLSGQIVGTCFGIPSAPNWTLELMSQAILIPVCWRLHLLSQLVPIAYFAVVYPLLGLTRVGTRSIYDSYTFAVFLNLFWVCLICNLAVYLYERLKRSEFESQRQLRVFLHSVSHDLKTPVMGTSIVLNNLLRKSEQKILIDRLVLERLLEGSDRQLNLINSLLEAHASEVRGIALNREPLSLNDLVNAVLSDLEPVLHQNHITLINRIHAELPLVNGDATQLWRVFSNLITNALKHNPHGITITLNTEVLGDGELGIQWIRCTVQDNGIGMKPEQCRRLFELYVRGSRARYMPGLGLGLYLCKQIVAAHGGEIGVISHPGAGATFWFTLPAQ